MVRTPIASAAVDPAVSRTAYATKALKRVQITRRRTSKLAYLKCLKIAYDYDL
jgi:hypothetical protein